MDDGLQWLLTQRTENNHSNLLLASEDRSAYLQSVVIALQSLPPSATHPVSTTQLEDPIYGFAWSLESCFRYGDDSAELKVAVVDRLPGFFQWLSEHGLTEQNVAVFMFWDGLARTRTKSPVKNAMFAALAHQLFIPDENIQASAAHGFNHLKDTRALPLLAHLARTATSSDLREYATAAAGFNLM